MSGDPSKRATLELMMNRDLPQQESMTLPRRRLTNNRINLTRPKKTQQDIQNTNAAAVSSPAPHTRGAVNDPIPLIDEAFHAATNPRRRTVQINEILASQTPRENLGFNHNDSSNFTTRNDFNRKRLAISNETYTYNKEPKIQDPTSMNSNDNLYGAQSVWDDRRYEQELQAAQEMIQLYKDQLTEKTLQYEELLHARTTKQEEALENFTEWRQPTEEGYLQLRDQVEEFLSKNKDLDPTLSDTLQQDETLKLKAIIRQLQSDLKEKTKATSEESQYLIDLYEDLTGVVVQDIKNGEDIKSYKCIIAGKNGTLQFALSIGRGKNSYVLYSPTLDRQRDSRLLATFPNFLKEDIEFERENLPRFFAKLSQLLN